jgi:Holliday junction resolvase RusA-like endonuclease
VDKLTRSLLDACTGIVWEDDSQVVELQVLKAYSDEAYTTGTVVPLSLAA